MTSLPGNERQAIVVVAPTDGVLTSGYGQRRYPLRRRRTEFHEGVDVANRCGTEIRATASGRVLRAERERGYGLVIEITHGNGWTSLYAHLSRAAVSTGDFVRPGAVIGAMGRSGATTGSHLHYELRQYGVAINPLPYLNAATQLFAGVTF